MRKLFVICVLIVFFFSACAGLKPHSRPWTKTEKQCAGFFILAHAADAYTTEAYLDNPANWETINPALGEHPSDKKVAFYFSLTGIGALALSHWYPWFRQPFLLGYGALNTSLAIYNSRLD